MVSAQFFRFCAVGAGSAAGSLAMFAALMSIGHVPYLPAFALTFCVMNVFGYLASRRVTFSTTSVSVRGGVLTWFGIALLLLALNTGAMRLLVGGLGLHALVASTLLAVANAPMSYLLHRRVTFRFARGG